MEEGSDAVIRVRRRFADAEHVRGGGQETEQRKRRPGIAAITHLPVIPELGEGFTRNRLRHDQTPALLTCGGDRADRPEVAAIATIDGGNQQSRFDEGAQRAYTV